MMTRAPSCSPELQFVLASVRASGRAVDAATVGDWARVAALAVRHDVPWWVWRALPSEGADAARASLHDPVRTLAMAALDGTAQLLLLVRAFETAGVPMVAYKGPALAADVHGDVAARRFTDLDLLIAEHDRAAAEQVMRQAGYAPPAGYTERELRFYSTWEGVSHFACEGRLPVELHWRVQAPRYGAPQDPHDIVRGARRGALGGGVVPLPDAETQGVLVALHGVKHGWTSLLWAVDAAHALDRAGFDWSRCQSIAAQWGTSRALHVAVLVVTQLALGEVPADVLTAAQRDAAAVRLADDAARGLMSDAAHPNAGRESTARYDLQWIEGAWRRARYLALAAALPTPQERKAARLPDALLPLAYPVRAWRLLRRASGAR